ncbi:uncharacterized protein LOC128957431 [Oppia nitens]|uniref:uncharacterized protein LOC128957431 n=1 Tax=Oppia nitens TaxID=1686743 RepID=UPI0023DA5A29|nr:uncharacterized protein LOC128957431 [Oppia nitens]
MIVKNLLSLTLRTVLVVVLILICVMASNNTVADDDTGAGDSKYDTFKMCLNSNERFISLFNLGNDLIFQTLEGFIKLKDSIDRDIGLERLPFLRSKFINDYRMRDQLAKHFNVSEPIFGFTYQFMSRECGELDSIDNECSQIYDNSQAYYTCIYGHENNTGKITHISRKYNQSYIEHILTPKLLERTEKYCALRYKHEENILSKEGVLSGTSFRLPHYPSRIIKLNQTVDNTTVDVSFNETDGSESNTTTGSNETLSDNYMPLYEDKITYMVFTSEPINITRNATVNLLGYQFCKVYDDNLTDTSNNNWLSGYRYHLPKSQIYYVFRYLNITFACPQNCTLRSPLSVIEVSKELKMWWSGELFGTNQSFYSLFGCDSYDVVYVNNFSPNDFCAEQRSQSVFTMGDDLYMQNNGRFWRSYGKRFTNPRGSPKPVLTLSGIVFDSDTTQVINDEGFDITQPVMGFTFKYFTINPLSLSSCDKNTWKSVRCRLYLMPDHYRACIYGYKIGQNGQNTNTKMESLPFEYTAAGLRKILNKYWVGSLELRDVYQETRSICDYILFKILEIPHVTKMHSITVRNRNSSYGYRQWFGIQAMVTVREPNKPEALELIDAEINKQPHHIMNEAEFVYNRTAIHVSVKLGLGNGEETHTEYGMYYTNQSWIFSTRRKTSDNMLQIERILQKNMLINHSHSLQRFHECPFNQSYTLITESRQVVGGCPTGNNSFIGVFNAGEQVYFQSGRRFYRYNKLRKTFVYDRYATNVLNDHFDTKHRIIGYSYLNFGNQFRTVIVGRPKWRDISMYKNLTLVSLYRMYYTIKGQMSALIPDNEAELYYVKYPFDTIDKQYLDINITSDSILGIGYLQRSMSWKQYKDRMLSNADLYPPGKQTNPFVVIYDKKEYNLLNVSKNLIQLGGYPAPFVHFMPFSQEFQSFKTDYKRNDFKNIMGLFALDGDLYLVALKTGDTVYRVLKISTGDDLSTSVVSDTKFDDFFQCIPREESSSTNSKSSQGSGKILLLAVLVLIVIILMVMVAVIPCPTPSGSAKTVTEQSVSDKSVGEEKSVSKSKSTESVTDNSADNSVPKSNENQTQQQ